MSDNWAYASLGRLHRHDEWDWFRPPGGAQAAELVDNMYNLSRVGYVIKTNASREVVGGVAKNLIGFDGSRWFSGRLDLPLCVLDSTKYPMEKYSCDRGGRLIHFLHGYTSESKDFPTALPLVDGTQYKALHEKNILPLWERELVEQIGFKSERSKVVSSYAIPPKLTDITSHLPPDAIALLREAHRTSTPIALQYNSDTKEWGKPLELSSAMDRKARERASRAGTQVHPDSGVAPSDSLWHIEQTQTTRTVEPLAKSWVSRFNEMHIGKKLAIVGGTVAVGAMLGYLVFKPRHQDTEMNR